MLVVREFFEETTRIIFDVDFWTISLIDLINAGQTRLHLMEAQRAFENGDHATTLTECRKALYCEFEWHFNVKMFEAEEGALNVLAAFGCHAPDWAKNKQYIERYVKEPCDYIVLDHERLERELTANGINHATFSNIQRLTPAVHRDHPEAQWVVKNDLHVFEGDGIEDRASYVLESTIDVVLANHVRRRSVRYLVRTTRFVVNLKRAEVPLYKKADRTSGIEIVTPRELKELRVDSSCQGLRDDGNYWKVGYYYNDPLEQDAIHLSGYLHEDDVAY